MKKKIDIFMVNSLSSGGAERVVANLANKMAELNKEVIIFTVEDKVVYDMNKNVKVIPLNNKKLSGIKKILMMPILAKRLTKQLKEIEKKYEIGLYTSHLNYSHFISRMSKYHKKCAFVMHNPLAPYDNYFLYKLEKKCLYKNQNVITVSFGVEKEFKEIYKIKTKNIATVYNPIDVNEIVRKSMENIDIPSKNYILYCGRFNEQKRPDMAVEIFYQNELYKKYDLVMIGQGQLFDQVKEQIKKYNIEKNVYLMGWSSNPYAYMKNALMLLNSSKSEACPMTILEAFACNCKVVSYDINYGPNELLVDDLSKYLVLNNDIKKMGDTIKLAINEYPSNLKERALKFQTEQIIENYYTIVNKWRENEKN